MKMLALAYYGLRRIARHRRLVVAMAAMPLVGSLARAALPAWPVTLGIAWATPFVCAGFAAAVLYAQWAADNSTGFSDALAASPLTPAARLAGRLLPGLVILALQMAVFALILAA